MEDMLFFVEQKETSKISFFDKFSSQNNSKSRISKNRISQPDQSGSSPKNAEEEEQKVYFKFEDDD